MQNGKTDRAEPRFDIDYKVGRQGELWVVSIREAMQNGRVEVKTDEIWNGTGNIYVEYACLKRGKYRKSGLSVTTADIWVFVLREPELAIVFETETLKKLCKTAFEDPANRDGLDELRLRLRNRV